MADDEIKPPEAPVLNKKTDAKKGFLSRLLKRDDKKANVEEKVPEVITNIDSSEKAIFEEPPAFEEKDYGEISKKLETPKEEPKALDEDKMDDLSSFRLKDDADIDHIKSEFDKIDEQIQEPEMLTKEEVKEPAKMEPIKWMDEKPKEEKKQPSLWIDDPIKPPTPKKVEKPVKAEKPVKVVKPILKADHVLSGTMNKEKGKVKLEVKKIISKPEIKKIPEVVKQAKKAMEKKPEVKPVKKTEVKHVKIVHPKVVHPKKIEHKVFKTKPLPKAEVQKLVQEIKGKLNVDKFIAALEAENQAFGREAQQMVKGESVDRLSLQAMKQELQRLKNRVALNESHQFVLKDGKKLKNLAELIAALTKMKDDVFRYHVTETKNDFARWIAGAMQEPELAKKVDEYLQKQDVLNVLKEYLPAHNREIIQTKKQIALLENSIKQQEKKQIDEQQFFKVHKATSLDSLMKLLQTLSKMSGKGYDEIIINNKKEFANWLKDFVKTQKAAEDVKVKPIRAELTKLLEKHQEIVNKELKDKSAELQKIIKQAREVELAHRKKEIELQKNIDEFEKEKKKIIGSANKHLDDVKKHYEDLSAELKKHHDSLSAELKERLEKDKREYVAQFDKAKKQFANEKEDFFIAKSQHENTVKAKEDKVNALKLELDTRLEQMKKGRSLMDSEKQKLEQEKKKFTDVQKSQILDLEKQLKDIDADIARKTALFAKEQAKHEQIIKLQSDKGLKDLTREKQKYYAYKTKEEEKLSSLRNKLHSEALHLENLKRELTSQESRLKEEIRKQRDSIQSDVEKIRSLHDNMETIESDIRKEKQDLEKTGFKKYLEKKLQEIEPAVPEIEVEDSDEVEVEKAEHLDFYHQIEECKDLLRQHKLKDAKILYNQLRERFNSSSIEPSSKSQLYNNIRELYDDIYLASMEEE